MKALVVEDNERLAEFIKMGLVQAGFVCDGATSLGYASALVETVVFDVIILDLGLPDGDGLRWLKKLRASGNAVPVLILTARGGPGDRVSGLDTGADDYVVKPFEIAELLARCRALLRRPGAVLGPVLAVGDVSLLTAERTVTVNGAQVELGKRETGILESLMRRGGKVVTRETMEQQVYSFDDEFTPNALEAAMSRLRKKLSEAGSKADIQTVRGVGYIMTEG